MVADEQIGEIGVRHKERKEYHSHIPTGPCFYDSMGFVHNEVGPRPVDTPAPRALRAGLLVRSSDGFDAIDIDANLRKTDSAVGMDLEQYVALTLDHDVELDIAALLA